MSSRRRILIAAEVLGPLGLYVSLWSVFVLASGIDDLDGVSAWDGDCVATSFGASLVQIASGGLVTAGLWAVLVGWALDRRWWPWGAWGVVLGVCMFVVGLATLSGATVDLPAVRCSS